MSGGASVSLWVIGSTLLDMNPSLSPALILNLAFHQ